MYSTVVELFNAWIKEARMLLDGTTVHVVMKNENNTVPSNKYIGVKY